MKDLLSKENYCYKCHTLLMNSSAYSSPFLLPSPPPLPAPIFTKKSRASLSINFRNCLVVYRWYLKVAVINVFIHDSFCYYCCCFCYYYFCYYYCSSYFYHYCTISHYILFTILWYIYIYTYIYIIYIYIYLY